MLSGIGLAFGSNAHNSASLRATGGIGTKRPPRICAPGGRNGPNTSAGGGAVTAWFFALANGLVLRFSHQTPSFE
jgi:hypothetical protein